MQRHSTPHMVSDGAQGQAVAATVALGQYSGMAGTTNRHVHLLCTVHKVGQLAMKPGLSLAVLWGSWK